MAFEDRDKKIGKETFFCRHLKPIDTSDPKCLVFVCHGFAEHIGRYEALFELLARQGCYVFGHDHCGHGKTTGRRIKAKSCGDYTHPIKIHIEETAKMYPDKKIFVYGHSMGGLVAIRLAQQYEGLVSGLVLEGPALGIPDYVPKWQVSLGVRLGRYKATSWLPIGKLNKNDISRTAELNDDMDSDPLVYHGAPKALTAATLVDAKEAAFSQAADLKIPVFIGHGSDDRLCPLMGSAHFIEAAGSEDKTLKKYDEALHNLRLEQHRNIGQNFTEDVTGWIEAHC